MSTTTTASTKAPATEAPNGQAAAPTVETPQTPHHIIMLPIDFFETKKGEAVIVETCQSTGEAKKKVKDPDFLKKALGEHNKTEALFAVSTPANTYRIRPVSTFVADEF